MTAQQVQDQLNLAGVYADSFSKSRNVFTFRRGFFYRHGEDAGKYVELIKQAFPMAIILDFGEVWKPFKGGASVAKQSHWYVKFMLKN